MSALSPFSARYTSINFTTSQSGECGTETMMKMRRSREKCSDDDDICVNTVCVSMSACVCVSVCLGFLPLSPSISLSLLSVSLCSIFSAAALWTGGCSRLQYPVRSHYSHGGGRKGQMRNGKTKRQTERDRRVGERRGEWGIVQDTIIQFSKKLIKIY